jgi:hypothetical protein
MLRRTIVTALTTLLLATGLTSAPTATAAVTYDNSIGIVKMPDQVRKGKCAYYRLNWRFTPPSDQWTVLVRIRAPRGFSVATQFWDSNARNNLSRKQGHLPIQLCGSSIKPGRYTIEMQMVYDTSIRDRYTVNRRPTHFRLLRR